MNTQQLKELALIWSRSEVSCMPINQFSDLTGTPLEDVRVLFGAANALDSLVEKLESAERERDELRKTLHATQDGAIEAINHAMQLQAELARRDAEVSEPVAVLYRNGDVLTKAECGEYFEICCKVETPLYTAAPPAVLPELEQDVKNIIGLLSENEWAEHCTKSELGRKLEGEITRLHDLRAAPAPRGDGG